MGVRVRLYDYWQIVWRKWSVRFNAAGIAILSYLTIVPDSIVHLYSILPDELKAVVPVKYSLYISLCLFLLGLLSNYIKQEKLQEKLNDLKAKDGTNPNSIAQS